MSGWNPHQKKLAARIRGDLNWCVQHAALIGYTEARPYHHPPRWPRPHQPWQIDCTGFIKMVVCDWNNIPSFDGEPSGYGNTQTFADSPYVYAVPGLAHAQPLDICLYDADGGGFHGGPGEHATILDHKLGGVWYACSHGGPDDPRYIQAEYRDIVKIVRFRIPSK